MKSCQSLIILCLMAIVCSQTSMAQVYVRKGTVEEMSVSFRSLSFPRDFHTYTVPADSISRIQGENNNITTIGRSIHLSDSAIKSKGYWINWMNEIVWTVKIKASDAKLLSLFFDEFHIPINCRLYVYSPDDQTVIGPYTYRNNPTRGHYSTGFLRGDEIVVEYHQPNTAEITNLPFSISGIMFGIKDILAADNNFSRPASVSDLDNSWSDPINSVCMLIRHPDSIGYVSKETRTGTGVLVNNTAFDGTPYILTAAHVVTRSDTNPSQWVFRFKYTGSLQDTNDYYVDCSGGELMELWKDSNNTTDVALLKMDERPLSENNLYFAGWDISGRVPSNVTLLQHPPMGSFFMRYCASSSNIHYNNNHHYLYPCFDSGCTVDGSSGSPLFDHNKRLLAVNHGSGEMATLLGVSTPIAGINTTPLSHWTDPLSTQNSILGGYRMPDLFIRDSLTDNGSTPNNIMRMWNSPDIWFENLSGTPCATVESDQAYYVCVRIFNRSSFASTGREKLIINWTKAGINSTWPTSWIGESYFVYENTTTPIGGYLTDEDGVFVPAIPAGGSTIVRVMWHTPSVETDFTFPSISLSRRFWQYSLVARIHDGEEILYENDNNVEMNYFATHNNNVAWKNFTMISDLNSGVLFSVANPFDTATTFVVEFDVDSSSLEMLQKDAEVYIHMDYDLYYSWVEGGAQGCGVAFDETGRFQIRNNHVILRNINIQSQRLHPMYVEVCHHVKSQSQKDTIQFDVMLFTQNDSVFVGGQHVMSVKKHDRFFEAVAHDSKEILPNTQVTLWAESIGEAAEYRWYDESDSIVEYGSELIVSPTTSQNYSLEVIALTDGYRDYDTVSIIVKEDAILSISPNPTSGLFFVSYRLSERHMEAKMEILSQMGNIVQREILLNPEGNAVFDIRDQPRGLYTILLRSTDGSILDTKNLFL